MVFQQRTDAVNYDLVIIYNSDSNFVHVLLSARNLRNRHVNSNECAFARGRIPLHGAV